MSLDALLTALNACCIPNSLRVTAEGNSLCMKCKLLLHDRRLRKWHVQLAVLSWMGNMSTDPSIII